jgi:hypothetical protein
MKSSTFRNLAVGALALTAAYLAGASSTHAQTGSIFDCAGGSWVNGSPEFEAVVGRFAYTWPGGGNANQATATLDCTAPIPGSAPVIACTTHYVLLGDDTVYQTDGAHWTLVGGFPFGATPVQTETLGRLKSRFAR